MPGLQLSAFTSSKFRFWSFAAMVLLVFVHGYNLPERYLQPWTIPGEPLSFTGFTEYFFANGILRFRIPMLFIISGFLFAMRDDVPYRQRIRKRFRTLFLPYIIWSAAGLAFTYALEFTDYGRSLVAASGVVQIDNTRMLLHDYRWYEMLGRWLILPVPYQLWFLRVLFIYNLAYPAIRWCITHRIARWIFFSVAVLMWLGTMGFVFFEGEGLLFFSLGILIQKSGFSIETPGKGFRPLWWGLLFVALAAGKTVLAFAGLPLLGNAVYPVMILMHKGVVVSGLIACWFGFDPLVRWCMARPWFVWLSAFSFIIYAMHAPLVAYLINPALALGPAIPGFALLTFVWLPLAIITLAVLTGAALRALFPGFYSILTGGRGL
jgi:fucose 4-O-acetylase-like acetyltransferase